MKKIDGWDFYKKAWIPTCAPHETPDTAPIFDQKIWGEEYGSALFARWTTDFDCGYDTGWYYIIKEAPFDIQDLEAKSRKHIRQALKKTYVKKVDPREYAEQLYAVDLAVCKTYENYKMYRTLEELQNCTDEQIDYWAAFSAEDDRLVGFMKCRRMGAYVETLVGKYAPQDLNLRASDALHYSILEYYLNEKGYRYVCSGSKNISHKTNAQEYKIKSFGFRKAYCILHIHYRPGMKAVVNVLYVLRKLLGQFDNIGLIHKINGVLTMEEISRKQRHTAK